MGLIDTRLWAIEKIDKDLRKGGIVMSLPLWGSRFKHFFLGGQPTSKSSDRQILDKVILIFQSRDLKSLWSVASQSRVIADPESPQQIESPLKTRRLSENGQKTVLHESIHALQQTDIPTPESESPHSKPRQSFKLLRFSWKFYSE